MADRRLEILVGPLLCFLCLLTSQEVRAQPGALASCRLTASPSKGSAGSVISVHTNSSCSNLSLSLAVQAIGFFNVTNVPLTKQNDSLLTFIFPSTPFSNVNATLVFQLTQGNVTVGRRSAFTVFPGLNITSIDPPSGQPGALLTLRGCFPPICGDANPNVSVLFQNRSVAIVTRSGDLLTFRAPLTPASNVTIRVTTATQASTAVPWILSPASQILSVSPSLGQSGTVVSVRGRNLFGLGGVDGRAPLPVATVTVTLDGRVAAVDASRSTPSLLVARIVACLASCNLSTVANYTRGPAVVTSAYGASSALPNAFARLRDGRITSLSPPQGQVGTRVTLNGTQLFGYGDGNLSVTFDGVNATVTASSTGSIQVIVPLLLNSSFDLPISILVTATSGAVVPASQTWLSLTPGTIRTVSPLVGQEGTYVTINGTDLFGNGTELARIQLGTANVSVINSANTHIVLLVTGGRFGTGSVRLESNTGAVVERVDLLWSLRPPGTITSISPLHGQRGTIVTLQGVQLTGYADRVVAVAFGNAPARIVSDARNTSFLQVQVEQHSGVLNSTTVDVQLTTSSGVVLVSRRAWTYLTPGMVSSVDPALGQVGTFVTVTGTGMLNGGASIAQVRLGNATTTVLASNDTYVRVRVTGGAPGNASLLLVADTGATLMQDNRIWTLRPAGNISSISPSSGQFGARIVIRGSNLLGYGSSVRSMTVNGVPVFGLSLYNQTDTYISCQLGAANPGSNISAGVGAITIESDTGAMVEKRLKFTYAVAMPITGVQPSQGGEGSLLVITGGNLFGAGGTSVASVRLGRGPPLLVLTSQSAVVVARVGAATAYANATALNVTVESNTGAIITAATAFRFNASTITAVTPPQGQNGTRVWVATSRAMRGDETVLLASAAATVVRRTAGSVLVEAGRPVRPGTITGDVVLTDGLGQVTRLVNGFTYVSETVLFGVEPSAGQLGTNVVISGRNLLGGGNNISTVFVGNAPLLVTSSSSSSISGRLNATPTGSDVRVQLSTGAGATLLSGWASRIGNITSLLPSAGQTGTVVTIRGSLLQAGDTLSWVSLNGVNATILWTNVTNTSIVVVAQSPAGSASNSSGSVIIVTTSGAIVRSESNWTFTPPARITLVSPASGQHATSVQITGDNLLAGGQIISAVLLRGRPAVVTGYSNTLVTVRAPFVGGAYNKSDAVGDVRVVANTGGFSARTNGWTDLPPGELTSVTPSSGQTGTRVTITGSSLLLAGGSLTGVTVGGAPAFGLGGTGSNRTLTARVNCSRTGSQTIGLQASNGAIFTGLNFTCLQPGRIVTASPTMGLPGTRITVNGTNLLGYGQRISKIELNGVDVDLTGVSALDYSNASITFVAPAVPTVAAATSPTLLLESDSGGMVGSEGNSAISWQYTNDTVIESVDPHVASPGDRIILRGQNLLLGATSLSRVWVGGVPALEILSAGDSQVTLTLGPSLESSPIVIVAANGGRFIESDANFTLDKTQAVDECTVLSVTPPAGQSGSEVVISGTDFNSTSVTRVWLAGREATVRTSNETSITVVAPAPLVITNRPDSVQVQIGSTGNAAVCGRNASWQFYSSSAITSSSPLTGREGTAVTVRSPQLFASLARRGVVPIRVGLAGNVQGLSGFTPANLTLAWSSVPVLVQQVQFLAASASSAAVGSVEITFNDTSVLRGAHWTYLAGNITSISPRNGSNGALVTIRGTNLIGGGQLKTVMLAGAVGDFVFSNETVIQVRVPANAPTPSGQMGPIVITSTTGAILRSRPSQQWQLTYLGNASVQPGQGQAGTRITLTGQFNDPSLLRNVTVGGIAARIIAPQSTSLITAALQDGPPTATAATVVVTWADGSSVSAAAPFVYLAPGNVTAVEPLASPYGSRVLLSGTGLLGGGSYATTVCLAGVPAQQVTLSTSEVIQVVAGEAGATNLSLCPGNEDLLVRADTGAEVRMESVGVVTSVPPPLLSVTPLVGQNGTRVTVTSSLPFPTSIVYVAFAGVRARVEQQGPMSVRVALAASPFHTSVSGGVEVRLATAAPQPGLPGQIITAGNVSFTYRPTGQITAVQPGRGQRGTRVTLTGRDLFGGGSALLSATVGKHRWTIVSQTNQLVQLRLNSTALVSQPPELVDIQLEANTGAIVQLSNAFTYLQHSTVTNLEPSRGRWGTRVALFGQRLFGGGTRSATITVGQDTVSTVLNETSTSLLFRLPLSTSRTLPDNVTIVIESNTGALTTSPVPFLVLPQSIVTAVQPSNGKSNTTLCVDGLGLLGGGRTVTSASIAGIAATVINSTDTQVCIVSGRNNKGTAIPNATVVLESNSGALTQVDGQWSYIGECSLSQYFNKSTTTCESCSPACDGCMGSGPTNCVDCGGNGYFRRVSGVDTCILECPTVLQGKQCVSLCASSEYAEVNTTTGSRHCVACDGECAACRGPSAANCTSCRTANSSGLCVSQCPANTFLRSSTGVCEACDAQCFNCSGPTANECRACRFFSLGGVVYRNLTDVVAEVPVVTCVPACRSDSYSDSLRQCQKCHPQCIGCVGPSARDCNVCRAVKLLTGECSETCPTAHYTNRSQDCIPCKTNCANCTGSSAVLGAGCTACDGGSLVSEDENGSLSCTGSLCPPRHYQNASIGVCIACPASCSAGCEANSADCLPESSTDVFAYGIGSLGIAAGVAVLLILLICILCLLRCRQQRKSKYDISADGPPDQPGIRMKETALHGASKASNDQEQHLLSSAGNSDVTLTQTTGSVSSDSLHRYQPDPTVIANPGAPPPLETTVECEQEEYLQMGGVDEDGVVSEEFYIDMDEAKARGAAVQRSVSGVTSRQVSGDTAAAATHRPPAAAAQQQQQQPPDDELPGEMYEDMAATTVLAAKRQSLPRAGAPPLEVQDDSVTEDLLYEDMATGMDKPPSHAAPVVAQQPQRMATRSVRSKSYTQAEMNATLAATAAAPPPAGNSGGPPVNRIPLPARSNRPVSQLSVDGPSSPVGYQPPPTHHQPPPPTHHQPPMRSATAQTLPPRQRLPEDNVVGLPPRDRGKSANPPPPMHQAMSASYLPPAQRVPQSPTHGAVSQQRSLPQLPGVQDTRPLLLPGAQDIRPGRSNSRPPPPSGPPPPLDALSPQPALPPRNPGMARSAGAGGEEIVDDIYEVAQDDNDVLYEVA